ncbi:MAG: hypothetical protein JST24_00640 [Acidobacteria bacterium]|nr:hypothetical protein [Acidobacteriota bacterium]
MPELANDAPELLALLPAYKRARLVGLIICVAWPLLLMVMVATGTVKPGTAPLVGPAKQIGYTFTALVCIAAAWVTWRSGKVLKGFRELPAEERPRVVMRESVIYAAIFETSSLWGLLYWMMVGQNAARFVGTFMALTPLMFFLFVPRLHAWKLALEREDA